MSGVNRSKITPLGVGLLAVGIASCALVAHRASRSEIRVDSLARLQRGGTVRIGFANEAPFGYFDSRTGIVTGEAPEIARLILGRMGAGRVESVVTEFGALIPGLRAGRFDVIAAGMYITPVRAKQILFSNPTYGISETLLVRRGNPRSLHSFEDVAAAHDVRIGVMGGSVEHGYAKTVGVPRSRTAVFPDYPSALEGLRTGLVDAVAATVLTADDLLKKLAGDDIERASPFYDPVIDGRSVRGYGAFGFRKRDVALRNAFDDELARFIGTSEHLQLVAPFGFSEETLPGDVTAAQLIEGP